MLKISIAVSVGKESEESLTKMVREINTACSKINYIKSFNIIFSTDNYTPKESCDYVKKLSRKYKYVLANSVRVKEKGQTFARTYLAGFERAVKEGADAVVEMDVDSHDPKEIPNFIKGIKEGYDCVFSTRFSLGGGFLNYPKQRVFVSKAGTLLTNIAFLIFPPLPDLTSGYEAFSANFLKRFFKRTNIEDWVCVNVVPHLIQTEIRVLALKFGAKYKFVPILYGYKKKGKKFKFKYLYMALKGFVVLIYRFYTGKCFLKNS